MVCWKELIDVEEGACEICKILLRPQDCSSHDEVMKLSSKTAHDENSLMKSCLGPWTEAMSQVVA